MYEFVVLTFGHVVDLAVIVFFGRMIIGLICLD